MGTLVDFHLSCPFFLNRCFCAVTSNRGRLEVGGLHIIESLSSFGCIWAAYSASTALGSLTLPVISLFREGIGDMSLFAFQIYESRMHLTEAKCGDFLQHKHPNKVTAICLR